MEEDKNQALDQSSYRKAGCQTERFWRSGQGARASGSYLSKTR